MFFAPIRSSSPWDSTYKDESWISKYYPALQIIALFRGWVAQNYPGTKVAIYGAQRRSDSVLTLVFINKTANNLTSDLALKGFKPAATAQVYNYSSANSITLLVIPPRIG